MQVVVPVSIPTAAPGSTSRATTRAIAAFSGARVEARSRGGVGDDRLAVDLAVVVLPVELGEVAAEAAPDMPNCWRGDVDLTGLPQRSVCRADEYSVRPLHRSPATHGQRYRALRLPPVS